MLLEPVIERRLRDTEESRGDRLVASGDLERAGDHLLLDLLEAPDSLDRRVAPRGRRGVLRGHGSARWPPTRRTSFSWSTRRSFAWRPRLISPTSSRKSVPPLAVSKRPWCSLTAPVKAPASWPKSSLSRSGSASAAQLSARNGLA